MITLQRDTYKVDATDKILGRLASDIATHLIGKHKPTYQAHIDAGDVIVVENVAKIKVTGKKMEQKNYYSHSGFPGGLRTRNMGKVFAEDPRKILEYAVSRMLPKNKHRVERMKRLNIS